MDEREVEIEIDDNDPGRRAGLSGFLVGLVVGAVLGAGAAVLMAPRRGRVVRRQLKRRLEDIGEDARDRADAWREQAARRLNRRRLRSRRRSHN